MSSVSKAYTAVGVSDAIRVGPKESFTYVVTGTATASWAIQKKVGSGAWETIASGTADQASVTLRNDGFMSEQYRSACTAFTSGTMTVVVADVTGDEVGLPGSETSTVYDNAGNQLFRLTESGLEVKRLTVTDPVAKSMFIPAGALGKAGTTAGWVVAAGNNVNLATVPASQTASTFVLPIMGLKVGDTVTGFSLVGQIESAGNAVTIDADLRKQTAVAADVTDASLGTMTQISVTADTAITAANSLDTLATAEVMADGETLYLLITATTGASTDIALQGVTIYFEEVGTY